MPGPYTGCVNRHWIALVLALGCRGAPHDVPSNAANIADGVLVPTEIDPQITPVTGTAGVDARHYYCTPTNAKSWEGQPVVFFVGPREGPAGAPTLPRGAGRPRCR